MEELPAYSPDLDPLEERVSKIDGVLVGLIKGEIAATPLDEVVANSKPLDPGLFELARALAK